MTYYMWLGIDAEQYDRAKRFVSTSFEGVTIKGSGSGEPLLANRRAKHGR